MTKKRFKVWDKNNWGEVTWKDSRLEQLLHQVGQLPNNHLRMTTYKMTTPIPPYLASQQSNYSMVETVKRHRFSKEIAEELIAEHSASAHFYCLEKLEGEHAVNRELWRDVLTWIDELTGEEDASN